MSALVGLYSTPVAVIISSLIFGLWHLKNIFAYSKKELALQIFSTTVLLGPLTAILTIWTGTLWLAVIVHYIINLFAPVTLGEAERVLS